MLSSSQEEGERQRERERDRQTNLHAVIFSTSRKRELRN
jgi:hypothetical protein